MKTRLAMASVLAVAVVSLVWCQDTPPIPKKVILPEGTEVNLRMAQDISSRAARPGEPIELTLAEDLRVGDVLVARVGQRALGEVVQAKKPDFWGEAGEVSVRVHFLRVGDKKSRHPGRGRRGGNAVRDRARKPKESSSWELQ
jgi:hypothetical protein